MLKIRSITDKKDTAIDRLAKGLIPYMDRVDYKVIDCHPKRPSPYQLKMIEDECKDADLIDAQYFRTIEFLRNRYDWIRKKPTILTHHNPYSITESNWNDYDSVIANNETIQKELGKITESPVEYIPNTVDTDFWTFNLDWSPSDKVLMVANRIEGKKGILEVAQACKKIGARFVLVGSISDPDYYHEVIRVGGVELHQNIPDEDLRKLYYTSTVHVCNSVDNFESGTNPILEAMLCGTPVLTRNIGHVPELNNGENMVVRDGPKEDMEDIASQLKKMLSDKDKLKETREKAWGTAKNRSNERRAYLYQKLYRDVVFDQPSVSIVTPIADHPEYTQETLKAIENQTYKNIELIVVNDGEPQSVEVNVPMVKVIENNQNDYGLARARNKGIIEATGDVMVFCDQRMVMEPDAVQQFVDNLQRGKWIYGQKNGIRKEFIENFSCVYRDEVIRRGMFGERIDEYGGQSQYMRSMAKLNGMSLEYIEAAKANQIGKSSNRNRRRDEIIRSKNRLWRMGLEG